MENTPTTEIGDAFEERCAEIFRLLGYSVERDVLINDAQIDLFCKYRLGGAEFRLMVECKAFGADENGKPKLVGVSETNKFAGAFQVARARNQADRAHLITTNGFTRAARSFGAQAGVELLTYTQLLDNFADFSGYLNSVLADYGEEEVLKNYIPLNCIRTVSKCYADLDELKERHKDLHRRKEYEITEQGYEVRVPEVVDMETHVHEWLGEEGKNHLSILGDYGTGKTTFSKRIHFSLSRQILEGRSDVPVPMVIGLRDYQKAISIEQLITDVVSNKLNLPIRNYAAFKKLLAAGKILLIFDGFDEMATRIDSKITAENFREIAKAAVGNSKVLLTCRTHYFRDRQQEEDILANESGSDLMREIEGRPNFEIVYIEEFERDKVQQYLEKVFGDKWRYYDDQIAATYNLGELSRRPILLDIITKTLPLLDHKGGVLNPSVLYLTYTDFWIKHEDWRLNMSPEEKQLFTEGLALDMLSRNTLAIHYSEIPERILRHFSEVVQTSSRLDYFDNDVRTCSFLNRDEAGNYKFSHRSFLEFFVAKRIFRLIAKDSDDGLSREIDSREVGEFLGHFLLEDSRYVQDSMGVSGLSAERLASSLSVVRERLGGETSASVHLVALLQATDPDVRDSAVRALSAGAAGKKSILAELQKMRHAPSRRIRCLVNDLILAIKGYPYRDLGRLMRDRSERE